MKRCGGECHLANDMKKQRNQINCKGSTSSVDDISYQKISWYVLGAIGLILCIVYTKFIISQCIESVEWNNDLLPKIFHDRMPIKLIHSPTMKWNTSTWTFEKIIANLKEEKLTVHTASPPIFKHHDRHLELGKHIPQPFKTLTIKRNEIYDVMNQISSRGYYFNGELKTVAPKLMMDLESTESFVSPSSSSTMFIKLWLSSPGVIANLHYDATHNIFHQVKGTKRFILYPPECYEHLYLYSRLHPSHRQSQLDVTQPSDELLKTFPRYSQAVDHRIEITLHPGETMYLPPFWFHCVVVGEEPSISVNIWSDSHELELLELALRSPIPYLSPFEARGLVYDLSTHLFALQLYVKILLSHVMADPLEWIHLHAHSQSSYQSIDTFDCGEIPTDGAKMVNEMTPYVNQIFHQSFGKMGSNSSAIILMTSFIEALLAQYIDPLHVSAFLLHCVK